MYYVCRLDTNYLVKVSDGALSQEFFPNCYHVIKGALRPVRWAAPETFAEGLCTSQSNVVSIMTGSLYFIVCNEGSFYSVTNEDTVFSWFLYMRSIIVQLTL